MSEIRDLGHSTTPDDSYLDEMASQTRARAEQAAEWASDFTGAPEASRSGIAAGLDAAEGDLRGLLHAIHDLAETAFEEFESVAAIASVLEKHGIDVETGLYGVKFTAATTGSDTAHDPISPNTMPCPRSGMRSQHSSPPPESVLPRHPRLYAKTPTRVPGTVVLLDTPAEGDTSGKEGMARAGAFDGRRRSHHDGTVRLPTRCGWDAACSRSRIQGRRPRLGAALHGQHAADAANLLLSGTRPDAAAMPPISRLHAGHHRQRTRPSIITETATRAVLRPFEVPETLKSSPTGSRTRRRAPRS